MDRDGSGYLEEDELTAYLDRHVDNTVFTKEQIATLIAEADVDCDGQLSVEEFKAAMMCALGDERK
jgi:Ca2+-binding EF-hand superfamily protein